MKKGMFNFKLKITIKKHTKKIYFVLGQYFALCLKKTRACGKKNVGTTKIQE